VHSEHRVILAPALRQLAEEARQRRAQFAPGDSERQFFLGVDAAVQSLLHPEAAGARHPSWIRHETKAFRDGYLATIADITAVISKGVSPIRLSVPEPPAGPEWRQTASRRLAGSRAEPD
jgi:hypothetical protein